MTIHIEISNAGHNKKRPWRIRIGDCEDSTECSNITTSEVVEEVVDVIEELSQRTKNKEEVRG